MAQLSINCTSYLHFYSRNVAFFVYAKHSPDMEFIQCVRLCWRNEKRLLKMATSLIMCLWANSNLNKNRFICSSNIIEVLQNCAQGANFMFKNHLHLIFIRLANKSNHWPAESKPLPKSMWHLFKVLFDLASNVMTQLNVAF